MKKNLIFYFLTLSSISVAQSNPTLDLIFEQIQELRKEIAELKTEKTAIPERIEDAVLNEKIRTASEEYLYEYLKTFCILCSIIEFY